MFDPGEVPSPVLGLVKFDILLKLTSFCDKFSLYLELKLVVIFVTGWFTADFKVTLS